MYKYLTWEQRYIIYSLLRLDFKKKGIAEAIQVSPSTVSRAIRRNSGKRECIIRKALRLQGIQNYRSDSWGRENEGLIHFLHKEGVSRVNVNNLSFQSRTRSYFSNPR